MNRDPSPPDANKGRIRRICPESRDKRPVRSSQPRTAGWYLHQWLTIIGKDCNSIGMDRVARRMQTESQRANNFAAMAPHRKAAKETGNGPQSRTQAERTNHHWRLCRHQYRSARETPD